MMMMMIMVNRFVDQWLVFEVVYLGVRLLVEMARH